MRGFFSFAIAFFFLLGLAALLALESKSVQSSFDYSSKTLFLEKKHYLDLELKQAVRQVLKNSPGESEKEASEKTAVNLEKLERFWEEKMEREGFKADFWFGSVDEKEIREIISKSGKKCAYCFDFSEKTADWDKNVVFKSVEVLFDGKISRKGFVHTPSGVLWLGKTPVLGATVADARENFSFLVLIGEDFV